MGGFRFRFFLGFFLVVFSALFLFIVVFGFFCLLLVFVVLRRFVVL